MLKLNLDEKSLEFGTDFLANVVQLWEKEVDRFSELNIQISKLRYQDLQSYGFKNQGRSDV